MAAKCPKCGAPVEHDFGVTPCERCGTILFVDFSGNVQISQAEARPEASSEIAHDELGENPFEIPAEDLAVLNSENSATDFAGDTAWTPDAYTPENFAANESFAPVAEQGYAEPDHAESDQAHAESDPGHAAESVVEETPAYAEWNPDAGVLSSLEPESPLSKDGVLDFSDVVDFANRGELDNSPLVYRLRIEGIDHRDIRRKVESVLADPKLNFHLKDVLPLIKGGILELQDLSPVKASVIATRLRDESVQFYWSQSAFQAGGEEGDYNETGT